MPSAGGPPVSIDSDWGYQYVDGEWREPSSREQIRVTNPATGDILATVPAGTSEDVDTAFQAAVDAQQAWAEQTPPDRASIIDSFLDRFRELKSEIIEILIAESGSVRRKAEDEFAFTETILEDIRGHPYRNFGTHSQSITENKENVVKREPVGTVGIITPWNFPIILAMRAVAPALALGNSVVLKPAPETPISGGLLLAKLFEQAGLPDSLLNVVPGYGADAGDRLASHPDASVVSFTGSSEVGTVVGRNAVGNLNTPALELGGNNPFIVTDSADVEHAIDAGIYGTYDHQGQVCASINRHIVHESVYDEYVSKFTERASSLPVGDPDDDETVVGPMISKEQAERVGRFIDFSLSRGANVELGGEVDGRYVQPTVLTEVTNDMPIACNEHFGPVAPIISFESDEEAISLANDTKYGLTAGVFANDVRQAMEIANSIETGMVHVNDQPSNDDPQVPYGGRKSSGIGRNNGEAILREFTEEKWVSIQNRPREYPF